MLSVLANLHQCQELAATRVTDTALTAYASAIALVESELSRADALSGPQALPIDDPLARAQRILAELKAVLDNANRKRT